MDDLIRRRDALNCSNIVYIEYLETDDGGYLEGDADCIPVVKKQDIESISVVDAVEVRHGRWMFEEYPDGYYSSYCSLCGFSAAEDAYLSDWNYCPSCGARMDRHREDGDA